jgi:low affinity Fe/Cu permease
MADTAPSPVESTDPPEREGVFLKLADSVSEGMGKPLNIGLWLTAVVVWTLMFALSKQLDKGTFLPAWFISQGFNFPLNLITTVAELFIGFLVAAATNRAERALVTLIKHIYAQSDKIEAVEESLSTALAENTALTQQVHANTLLIQDLHRHVTALSRHFELKASDLDPPSSDPQPPNAPTQ